MSANIGVTGDMSHSTVLDMSSGPTDAASQLQFQDFPSNSQPTTRVSATPSFSSSSLPNHDENSPDEEGDDDVLLAKGHKNQSVPAFWELSYFARYFDVTTRDVVSRIAWSVLPLPPVPGSKSKSNYIERHIQSNPDLYGPLWINITLIFAIAICGNVASYLASPVDADWHYDFRKVGLAASTVTTYTLAVPTALWFFFWFRGCTSAYTLLETICAYGYSLSVYIPISVIWMFGITVVQYVLVIVGALMSGSVLVLSFAPVVQSDPSQTVKLAYLLLLLIIGMHALVAFTFLAYFY